MGRFIFTFPVAATLVSCAGPALTKTNPSDDASDVKTVMKALHDAPSPVWHYGARPGGAHVLEYNEPMKRLRAIGDRAVPILIANLDDENVRYQCVQILGDIRARKAVPKLLAMMKHKTTGMIF